MPKIKLGLPGNASLNLPKGERLLKNSDFLRVLEQGRRVRGRSITLTCAEGGPGASRVGISVPRSAVKRAVQRNRVKRLLREAYRHNKAAIRPGMDIVITCKRVPANRHEAEQFLMDLLKSAQLIDSKAPQ